MRLHQILACSTPFGIRDSTHRGSLSGQLTITCAQRLSASEIQHQIYSQSLQEPVAVLNAFRHQRFNTLGDRGVVIDLEGAQRLSASEIQHRYRRLT